MQWTVGPQSFTLTETELELHGLNIWTFFPHESCGMLGTQSLHDDPQ
jgi:hypothetical protein